MEYAFWTHDYISGVDALFGQLRTGSTQTSQFVAMVAQRSRVERTYAGELAKLAQEPVLAGSELASCGSEAVNEAVLHTRMADELESRVRQPLHGASESHRTQLEALEADLRRRITGYKRRVATSQKQRSAYYDKCRGAEPTSPREPVVSTLRGLKDMYITPPTQKTSLPEALDVAGLEYSRSQLGHLLERILGQVSVSEFRVPLLGSYMNVSSGAGIAAASRRHLRNDSIGYSEKFGQALVDLGILRPVGQLSNRFQSTPSSHYQWQPLAFELATPRTPPPDDDQASLQEGFTTTGDSSSSDTFAEEDDGEETIIAAEDTREGEAYLQSVLDLDMFRCDMEVEIERSYRRAGELERARVAALGQAITEYSRIVYRPDEIKTMKRRLGAVSLDPDTVLNDIIRHHRTGPLVPSVVVFRGFNHSFCQTFGVDISRSKFFVGLVLDYLRHSVPNVAAVEYWIQPEPLEDIYKLRAQVNTGRSFQPESLFRFFSVPIVIATLKQFLLELPESLVPFTVYDKFKQVYDFDGEIPRVEDVVSGLVVLPGDALNVLEQLIRYLGETYPDHIPELSSAMGLCVMRPRAVSAITTQDKHPERLVADLLRRPMLFDAVREQGTKRKRSPILSRRVVSTPPQPQLETPRTPIQRTASGGGLKPLTLTPERSSSNRQPVQGRGLGVPALPIARAPRRSLSGLPTRSDNNTSQTSQSQNSQDPNIDIISTERLASPGIISPRISPNISPRVRK